MSETPKTGFLKMRRILYIPNFANIAFACIYDCLKFSNRVKKICCIAKLLAFLFHSKSNNDRLCFPALRLYGFWSTQPLLVPLDPSIVLSKNDSFSSYKIFYSEYVLLSGGH